MGFLEAKTLLSYRLLIALWRLLRGQRSARKPMCDGAGLRKQGGSFYISGGYVPGKLFLAGSRTVESSSSDSLGIASILTSHGARSSQ